MLRLGLTGGIGAGKSTVARELERLGAVVVDADAIAREVVAIGTPGLAAVVAEFGEEVLTAGGALDRAALGRMVFADPAARARLEEITHPLIAAETARRVMDLPRGAVVVHDVPLIVERGLADRYDLVAVVGADEEVRLERLVRDRAMSREDALARIRAQATDAERRAVADVWLDNSGSAEELLTQVRRLWEERLRPRRDGDRSCRHI
ncbi:dephospho-CoA kinase [Georgenia satyanarayanai]|uniref:dephospho-CoA kinase n=1 Tax=Georgenia satyanarayanai TaxID=860221 RepID=UPI00203B1BC8|nr:dephospho-CoA kinase [Georgenia satyanarayanai]MCM3660041.1 dephospho-CoA kinase [Georgenia satyanarayanai]